VHALLRVLGDSKGKAAWGNACFDALGNMISKTSCRFQNSRF